MIITMIVLLIIITKTTGLGEEGLQPDPGHLQPPAPGDHYIITTISISVITVYIYICVYVYIYI